MNDIDNVHLLEKTEMTREQAEAMVKVIHESIGAALKPFAAEIKSEIATSQKQTTLIVVFTGLAIIAAVAAAMFG